MNYSYDNRSNADNTKHDNNGRFASENTRQIGSEAFHDKSIGCMIYYNDRGQRVYDFSGNNTGRRRIPPSPPKARAVFFIWLGVTLLLSLIPLFFREGWTLIAGLLQIPVVTYAFYSAAPEKRLRRVLRLFPLLILINAGLIGLRTTFPVYFRSISDKFFLCMFSCVFILLGSFIIGSSFHEAARKRRCSYPAQGTVTELITTETTDSD